MISEEEIIVAYDKIRHKYNFTYDLKDEQRQALRNIVNNIHCLVVLPTGFGKTDIFVLAPLILDEIKTNRKHHALVVIPLQSLMIDIRHKFQQRGVKIVVVTKRSMMDPKEIEGIKNHEYSVILVSPECLETIDEWRDILLHSKTYQEQTCVIAIDEAHLLIQWGEKFRPSYQALGELRSHMDSSPFVMLTATCTEEIKADIFRILHLRGDEVDTISKIPDRPNINLFFHAKHASSMEDALQWYIDEMKTSGRRTRKAIIYTRSIRHTGRGYGMLLYKARKAAFASPDPHFSTKLIAEYHAEVQDDDKARILEEFRKPDSIIRCLVSTVAFGMGIDIPDIRLVCHWGESDCVAQYWQEVGRAGRDGEPAEAHLYHRQNQLSLCKNDIRDLVETIKRGSCVREAVLTTLHVDGMPMFQRDTTKDMCTCCCNCSDKCQCEKCKMQQDTLVSSVRTLTL